MREFLYLFVRIPKIPLRNAIFSDADGGSGTEITYQGSAGKAYFLPAINCSHGASKGNILEKHNGSLDGWLTSTQPWDCLVAGDTPPTQQSTATGETVGGIDISKSGSTYCAGFIDAGVNPSLKLGVMLPPATTVTLAWDNWLLSTNAANRIKIRVQALGSADANDYLQTTNGAGTPGDPYTLWGSTASAYYHGAGSPQAWGTDSISFTTDAHANSEPALYQFTLFNDKGDPGGKDIYLSDISLTIDDPAYSWELHSGTTYKLDGQLPSKVGLAATPRLGALAKCTDAEWSLQGVDSLQYSRNTKNLNAANDETDLLPGEWFYNEPNNTLYYRLAANEAEIEDIHFEISDIDHLHLLSSATPKEGGVVLAGDYTNLSNVELYLSEKSGIVTSGDVNIVSDCTVYAIDVLGIGGGGTNGIFNDCEASYCEDGIDNTSGDTKYNRCKAINNRDDGFQSFGGLGVYNFCVSTGNGRAPHGEEGGNSQGFVTEGGNGEFYHCYSYNNENYGIVAGDGDTTVIKNCLSYLNGTKDVIDVAAVTAADHDYNWFRTKGGSWVTSANEIEDLTGDPKVTQEGKLLKTSPCINAGVFIDGVNEDGEPGFFGNFVYKLPDIGANQTNPAFSRQQGWARGRWWQ